MITPRIICIQLAIIGFNEKCEYIWSDKSDEAIMVSFSSQKDVNVKYGMYSYLAPNVSQVIEYANSLGYKLDICKYHDPLYGSRDLFKYTISLYDEGEEIPISIGESYLSDTKAIVECFYDFCSIIKKTNK